MLEIDEGDISILILLVLALIIWVRDPRLYRARLAVSVIRDRVVRFRVPRSIPAALNGLYTVADRRHQAGYQLGCNDTECPICLSSFGRRSSDISSHRDSQVDLEAGLESETVPASGFVWKNSPALQAMDTEILRLHRCGHAFHARCLLTWVLEGRADCPVCRTIFYPPFAKTMRLLRRSGERLKSVLAGYWSATVGGPRREAIGQLNYNMAWPAHNAMMRRTEAPGSGAGMDGFGRIISIRNGHGVFRSE
ncbi:hypothetical protein F4679DRAFT_403784 [Xylaria curta]|nr:hypothetical protein F4679DRAFT_403784 [Xylaria curta]